MLICNTPRPDIREEIGIGLVNWISEEGGGKGYSSGVGGEGCVRRGRKDEENFEGKSAED